MLRLILNDIRLNALGFMVVFTVFNLVLDLLSAGMMFHYRHMVGAEAGLFFGSVMVLYLFLNEEHNKGQINYRSLPVSHSKIVKARYLSIFLIAIACIAYGVLFQQIMLGFHPVHNSWRASVEMDWSYAIELSLIARGIALTLILAVAIPLLMRFSIPIMGILAGYLISIFIWFRLVDYVMKQSIHACFFLGLSRWSFFAVAAIIIVNFIAIRLSIWLYGQKEL